MTALVNGLLWFAMFAIPMLAGNFWLTLLANLPPSTHQLRLVISGPLGRRQE